MVEKYCWQYIRDIFSVPVCYISAATWRWLCDTTATVAVGKACCRTNSCFPLALVRSLNHITCWKRLPPGEDCATAARNGTSRLLRVGTFRYLAYSWAYKNRLLMRLFCTNNLSTVEECRHYFSIELPSELLRKRTEMFLRKLNGHCG